ncbi:hypothetical protein NYO67_4266 [Aspergillus flavus]|nr:hypothetical protein NYO67_4266 [Aspergillus flavus]
MIGEGVLPYEASTTLKTNIQALLMEEGRVPKATATTAATAATAVIATGPAAAATAAAIAAATTAATTAAVSTSGAAGLLNVWPLLPHCPG